ncbi:MAG: hypothetical protein ACSLFK_10595 [Gemmatimonadaceae bacterium]
MKSPRTSEYDLPPAASSEVSDYNGERIAQVVFVPHVSATFERGSVARTTDRDGWFGSTGS